jgi:hypothetical protein
MYSDTARGLPPMLMRSQHIQSLIVASEDEGDILIAQAEIVNASNEYGKDFAWYKEQLNSLAEAKLTNIRLLSLKRAFA